MRLFLPLSLLFALPAQAQLSVEVPRVLARYSDEASMEATVQRDGAAAQGVLVNFTLYSAQEDGSRGEQLCGAGSQRSDDNGIARVLLALDNGLCDTTHELKPDRSEAEMASSFRQGEYVLVANAVDLEAGDAGEGEGRFTLLPEQVSLEIQPLRRVAGDDALLVAELVDSDDDHDLNFTDGSVSEISQRGVQGRRLTFYLDRDGDSTFYDCQAGGLCHSGHCVGCIESSDCEAGQNCVGGECLVGDSPRAMCTSDSDCADFAGLRETRCVGGQCYGEVCDKLGYGVTDVLGRASITFSTIPNEEGMPAAGTLENRMRAEFSGDDYYAAVASTGTLTLLPDVVDIRGTTIEVTRAGEPVAEVAARSTEGLNVVATLRDRWGNAFGPLDSIYTQVGGDCSSCPPEATCDPIRGDRCVFYHQAEDLTFNASLGFFFGAPEQSQETGTFGSKWRPGEEAGEAKLSVTLAGEEGGEAFVTVFDDSGCGCQQTPGFWFIGLAVVLVARRRRFR
ncbi:MAG TPA: hypothetical protein DEB46_01220 [Myxococcales bacterium]|nr:hypothetical protein [Myxococcales bacterium]|tara:strand:- start:407 stop:1930 length:1524 start_codon:yes stop_codon:yes gene_type:complete